MAGDPCAWDGLEILTREFERGHDPDIGSARRKTVGANSRDSEFKIELIALWAVQHSPDEGSRVQVTDRAHAGKAGSGW